MTTVADIHGSLFTKFGAYDSDFADGYKKGDVVYNGANIYVATNDITPGTVFKTSDSELSDSEGWFLSLETAGTISQLKDVTLYDSDSEGAESYVLTHDYALTWDSDLGKWRPKEAASRVSNLKDVSFLDSDLGTINLLDSDDVLTWDGKRGKWLPKVVPRTLSSLVDVHPSIAGSIGQSKAHQQAILWDSDLQLWTTASVAFSSYSSKQYVQRFDTKVNQTKFSLDNVPNGDVTFVLNGAVLRPECSSINPDSDTEVIYHPEFNEQFAMHDSDEVFIHYVANDVALQVAGLNQLDDVKVQDAKPGDVLVYDSDNLEFKNANFYEDLFSAYGGQNHFTISPKPLLVTGFYRNGLRIKPAGWTPDSDMNSVKYIPAGNYNSPIDSDDIVQITYYR